MEFFVCYVRGKDFDLEESIWWLRVSPRSNRLENRKQTPKDLKKVASNFRKQEYSESPSKRLKDPHHLHNRAYSNDGGGGGFREYSPYIYLLPYWAGRYIKAIEPAPSNME